MLGSKNVRSMTPPKVRFLMSNKVLGSKKGGPQKWKKLFFSKKACLIFYRKSYIESVNLMGTSFTGICLEHQLLIFWFTWRGVFLNVVTKSSYNQILINSNTNYLRKHVQLFWYNCQQCEASSEQIVQETQGHKWRKCKHLNKSDIIV